MLAPLSVDWRPRRTQYLAELEHLQTVEFINTIKKRAENECNTLLRVLSSSCTGPAAQKNTPKFVQGKLEPPFVEPFPVFN